MANITWIKISTNIFDDEKIKLIDAMPDNDAILVIWFKLLVLAGKFNDNGFIRMNNIALNEEMLSSIFNRKITVVRNALKVFENFGMIEFENCIDIVNWEKHQNIDGMDKIKEQNKIRQKNFREKKKQLLLCENNENNVTDNVTVTGSNGTELELDLEQNKKKNINKPKFENFVSYNDYLNSIEDKNSDPYKLLIHIQKNYPEVAKMKYQMNLQNAIDLLKKYSKKEIDLILNNMDNWAPLLKNNKYVNKTIISWINK